MKAHQHHGAFNMHHKVDKRSSKMFFNARYMTGQSREGGSRTGDSKAGVKKFFKKVANRSLRHLPIEYDHEPA